MRHVARGDGGPPLALHAFLLDPTVQARLDTDQTEALLDEMLAANADYLPLLTQRARSSSGGALRDHGVWST